MKTVFLLLVALVLTWVRAFAQAPAVQPDPPFRLNFYVKYTGSKTHPELAEFIYKSLRALPGVGIVDKDPDAILIITEYADAKEYACSFVMLTPETPVLRMELQDVLESYDSGQRLRKSMGEPTDKGSEPEPYWRETLTTHIKNLPQMYSYGGSLTCVNASAKTALSLAVKSLNAGFVEKQRRECDYSLAHPLVLPPFVSPLNADGLLPGEPVSATPTPTAKP